MPATRHLFFALSPHAALRTALATEAERLRIAWGGRATHPAKLHMTLLFLDAVPAAIPASILDAARAAADTVAVPPFELAIDRTDRFGRRIGWLGCSQVPDALQHLHDALARACIERSVPMRREDAYVPHVTVLRDPRHAVPHAIAPLRWRVDAFQLMASAEGAYEVLGSWPLTCIPAR